MMTIKQFAELCSCNTQTLRYYDKIGLLKPAQVDSWTGYRYYEERQAVDFVKIRNLQVADFSIQEIRSLLNQSDEELCQAFDRKISEQQEKLDRIVEIQKSYLREKSMMEKLIRTISDAFEEQLDSFDAAEELGLTPEEGQRAKEAARTYLAGIMKKSMPSGEDVSLLVNDKIVHGAEQVLEKVQSMDVLNTEETVILGGKDVSTDDMVQANNFEPVWECIGWKQVCDFLPDIPALAENEVYQLSVEMEESRGIPGVAFAMCLIGAVLMRQKCDADITGCASEISRDGVNRFRLMKRKNL